MSLYFIRHGESQANKGGFLAGQMDVPITKKGIEQAKAAGEELLNSGIKIDRIISSPLIRAYRTALEIAHAIHYPIERIAINADLMERNMGTFQGKPVASKSLMNKLLDSEQEGQGIETLNMLRRRAHNVLDNVNWQDENVLLVSHNGFGRGLVSIVHDVDFSDTKRLPNARMVELKDRRLLNS